MIKLRIISKRNSRVRIHFYSNTAIVGSYARNFLYAKQKKSLKLGLQRLFNVEKCKTDARNVSFKSLKILFRYDR